MKIDILLRKLGKPAQRAIQDAGITTLEQFSNYSEKEIYELHGIGVNALNVIRLVLGDNGLTFSDKDS